MRFDVNLSSEPRLRPPALQGHQGPHAGVHAGERRCGGRSNMHHRPSGTLDICDASGDKVAEVGIFIFGVTITLLA